LRGKGRDQQQEWGASCPLVTHSFRPLAGKR